MEYASFISGSLNPSATTTIGERPRDLTLVTQAQIWSRLSGFSGIRMTWAPPAIPECRAIQPAWRPMTSRTMHRLCELPVVRRRSMASVAISTAVLNPKV